MKLSWFLGLMACLMVMSAVAVVWFGEFGGGEYRDSPDARWRADVMTVSYGTWFRGRVSEVKVEMTDNQSGRVVWSVRRTPLPGESLPEPRERSKQFVSWDAASTQATIDLGPMGVVRLPAP